MAFIIIWGAIFPMNFNKNLNYKLGSIGQMQLRLDDFRDVGDLDLLFVGSSTAYRGFDTRIFEQYNIKSFTLGSSAQTPIQTKYLLKKYLSQVDQKLLVIDINPLMFTIDGVESSLDLITNDEFNLDLVKMVFEVNHLKVYNTAIYAIYADVFNVHDNFVTPIERDGAKYISGGFVEHKLSFYKQVQYSKDRWDFKRKQFMAFNEIIKYLEENDIYYVVIQSPIVSDLYNSYINNEELDNFVKDKGKYYNFNKMLSLNDTLHFVDGFHLNQNGVEIYNRKLIEILEEDIVRIQTNK
jgi:hypothetical protein